MSERLCVYVLFDNKRQPLAAGTSGPDGRKVYDLYAQGCGTSVYAAEEAQRELAATINLAVANNQDVVTSDFKSIMAAFPIERARGVDYSVYDVCWATVTKVDDYKEARAVVTAMLDRLRTVKCRAWQRVFANAAVVYQALEDRGVLLDGRLVKPIWAQKTYSGRSKNLETNIQGVDGHAGLTNPDADEFDLHVHFDWVAADVRVASILSGDALLQESFESADPYVFIERVLTDEHGTIERSNCKLQLLQAINSFDFSHPVLESIYVTLGNWLRIAKKHLDEHGWLSSILGRRFKLSEARNTNPLAVLNGMLQGSVAHGIQTTIKRIWDIYGGLLTVEMHDSLSMVCKEEYVGSLIRSVVPIMTRPFVGLLESDPFFPVKVSVGRRFREWRAVRVYRESGVERINGAVEATKTRAEGAA